MDTNENIHQTEEGEMHASERPLTINCMFCGEAFVALQVVFKCVRVITHPLSQVI